MMDSKQLMVYGAKVRLQELDEERQDLMKLLGGKNGVVKVKDGRSAKRKPMSLAARKQVSLRLKAYWAERKAKMAGKGKK